MTVLPIEYARARPAMQVGDPIGCRSKKILGRGIRLFRGGAADWSHIMTVSDTPETATEGRLKIVHAVNKGMAFAPLTESLEAKHGELFWFPVHCNEDQQAYIRELAQEVVDANVKYDWWLTISAIWKPMRMELSRLNCSEAWWHFMTAVERFEPRLDKKGRMLAPAPGDAPEWAGVPGFFKLIF